ncbi:MAG: prepilin-type N-terminal cleavage/methylation domain-containing protein, partial [Planctomycetota bacterium]
MSLVRATMRSARAAFTLLELLIVVSIIVIGATLLLPAFGRVIESVNYSSAVSTVTAALGNARALAIRNGRHTGVAFYFDIEREVCSVQVLELNGQFGGSLSSVGGASRSSLYAFVY